MRKSSPNSCRRSDVERGVIKSALGIANENAMRIGLTSRAELQLHRAIELLSQQSNAKHADELSARIGDGLLDAHFRSALRLREFGIELRPVQIAPQELSEEILPRRRGKSGVRRWIGNVGAGFTEQRQR